ncbi:MAG: DUF2336 domain-containing protein [Sphingomonas sp.]
MAEGDMNGRGGQGDAARLLLAAARERFAVAATDLLLPDAARLTEWQRITAAALLSRLVACIEDDLRSRLAGHLAGQEAAVAALTSAHVPIAAPILDRAGALGDPELSAALVRRAEEHRFWTARRPGGGDDLLFELARDEDEEVASEAMALVIARSRRFDRFQEPVLASAELPAELQHKLIWLVAAALRHYLVQHHRLAGVDAAIEAAAAGAIGGHDEGDSLEATAQRLALRLDRAGRLDGAIAGRMIESGLLPLFLAALAVRCDLDPAAVWEVLADPRGRGPALLLRAAGFEREAAARILLALNATGPILSGAEGDATASQLELYDTLDPASAGETLRLWRAHPAYRASVARISTRARPVSAG